VARPPNILKLCPLQFPSKVRSPWAGLATDGPGGNPHMSVTIQAGMWPQGDRASEPVAKTRQAMMANTSFMAKHAGRSASSASSTHNNLWHVR